MHGFFNTVMCSAAFATLAIMVAAPAQAQTASTGSGQAYPNKLVRFIVTYPPGGSSDVMARIIGQQLGEYWGQQVIVESRPGADGSIGMEYASKQPADGYTFLLGNFGPVVAKPLLAKVNYDWQKDFAPVSRITNSANILVVPVTLPVKNAKELVALARARPGELSYGTSGPGSMSHFAGEMFQRIAGVKMITVNYKGNALAITDLMGGQITTMFSDAVPAMQAMKTGKLRAMAVTSEQRAALAVHAGVADAGGKRLERFCRSELVGHSVSRRRAAPDHRQSECGSGQGAGDTERENAFG